MAVPTAPKRTPSTSSRPPAVSCSQPQATTLYGQSKLAGTETLAACSQQHGLKVRGSVENILSACGFTLTRQSISLLCCGSAGTYSILQPDLSRRLAARKVKALCGDAPDVIATANVGCQLQLAGASNRPVRHWIELLDR